MVLFDFRDLHNFQFQWTIADRFKSIDLIHTFFVAASKLCTYNIINQNLFFKNKLFKRILL